MVVSAATVNVVYVGDSDAQDVSILQLNSDGTLTPRATVAVHRPARPGRSMLLAASHDRTLLYVGYLSAEARSSVATYAIEPRTGLLAPRGAAELPEVVSHLSLDRSGRFLFAASYAGNKVTVNAIRSDGTVGETLQVLATEAKAHCIMADPQNRTVLHTALGADVVRQDGFDAASGRLLPIDPPAIAGRPHAGPRYLVFSRDGRFVYVINELDGTLDAYPYDPVLGRLQPSIQSITVLPPGFAGKPSAADLHLTPDGRFLYGSERSGSTLTAFRVDAGSGTLTPIGTFATARQPRAFDIDPAGRYLVASGQLSDSVVSHAIDPRDGRLTVVGEYPVGKNPLAVLIVGLA
jgi:6-phosphogluconolactonase